MKKIFVLIGIAVIFCMGSNAQSTVKRVSTETIGTFNLSADTMQITRLDKVIKLSIYNPSFSTDSVKVYGYTFTVDGITTSEIAIPPGEATVNLGFDYAYLDSMRIIAVDKAWLLMLKRLD